MDTVNLYDAKTNLSNLVERAARGEEIVIAKAGRPLSRLVPLARRTTLTTVQAMVENLVLVTSDSLMGRYDVRILGSTGP